MEILKQLEEIEKLPVKSKRCVSASWYQTFYDQTFTEWYKDNKNNFSYRFVIQNKECSIMIDYHMWGETELKTITATTTEKAIIKMLTWFKKHYNNGNFGTAFAY